MKTVYSILFALFLALPIMGLSAEKININTADKATLIEAIDGVGEKKAEAIIQYRKENGPFKSVDELINVKGIGEAIISKHYKNLSTE